MLWASRSDVQWTGDPYALTHALTFDAANKASIVSCIISARENSRHVREQISTEQWHRLNSPLSAGHAAGDADDMHAEALMGDAWRTSRRNFCSR